MGDIIVDTNVPMVANGQAPHCGAACESACIDALDDVRRMQCLLLDDGGAILDQYLRNLSLSGQPGVGDAFFKWVWDHQGDPEHCRAVSVTRLGDAGYAEFPGDPSLARFDLGDRVFVAVAVASRSHPAILNACDRDWWEFRDALRASGVEVRFLCPESMEVRSQGDGPR